MSNGKKSRRKVLFLKKGPASAVSCKRTESAESLDKNKTQKLVVFLMMHGLN
jgi:hypothetical protein